MLTPFGNLINITANAGGSLPTGQCRGRVTSDIGSVVSGIVESRSVARGSVESGIKASGSDEK